MSRLKEMEKNRFQALWLKYFKDTELPITAYYTDDDNIQENTSTNNCLIANLNNVSARFNHVIPTDDYELTFSVHYPK